MINNITNILYALIFIGGIIFVLTKSRKDKLKRAGLWEVKQAQKYRKKAIFYSQNVFTRRSFRELVTVLSTMECYSEATLLEKAVKIYSKTLMLAIAFPVVGLFVGKSLVIAGILALTGMIFFQSTLTKRVDEVHQEILSQMSIVLASIREKYLESYSVTNALLSCDKPAMLKVPIDKIYNILSSADSLNKLEEFQSAYPVKVLNTLSNMCYIVLDQGDEIDREKGRSAFVDNLQILRQECDMKILLLIQKKAGFKSFPKITIAAIVMYTALQMFCRSILPGASSIADGLIGQVGTIVFILFDMFVYYKVSNNQKNSVVNESDVKKSMLDMLDTKPKLLKIVKNFIPKDTKKIVKIKTLLTESLSRKTIEYFYLQKIIFAFSFWAFGFILLTGALITAKINIANNYGAMNMGDEVAMHKEIVERRKPLDKEFLEMTDEELAAMEEKTRIIKVRSALSVDEATAITEFNRIETKREYYKTVKFDVKLALAAVALGIVGWHFPTYILKQRRKLVQYEAEEDIAQIQTMLLTLSNTNMDVWKVLYWLYRQSDLHQIILKTAYEGFLINPEKALDRLTASSPSMEFRRIVRKLKSAVYDLSVREAFSDMYHEKQNSLMLAQQKAKEVLSQRIATSKAMTNAVFFVSIIIAFVIPVGILAAKKFTSIDYEAQ